MKLFLLPLLLWTKKRSFLPGMALQLSLIFVDKDRENLIFVGKPRSLPLDLATLLGLFVFSTNMRLSL